MVEHPKECPLKYNKLADIIFKHKRLSSMEGDRCKCQFEGVLKSVCILNKDKFVNFDKQSGRLDTFFGELMGHDTKYSDLWKVCQFVFVLSHGQSQTERGFNVNKEILIEYLQKLSLISQRIVYYHMKDSGDDIANFVISKDLAKSCKRAHKRYAAALETKKEGEQKSKAEKNGKPYKKKLSK